MDEYESLSQTTWTCKYHVVFIQISNIAVPPTTFRATEKFCIARRCFLESPQT